MIKKLIIAPLVLSVILVFFGCATDENQFEDSFANDQFQWMETDGVTEDHITDGAEMDQVTNPSGQGHQGYNPSQRRVAPRQPQQGQNQYQYQQRSAPRQPQQDHSPGDDGVGGGWIGDSIPMDPNH